MRLELRNPPDHDERVYVLTITGGDLMRMKLHKWDRVLLRDCDKPDATIADKLLALELMARRIEEAA